MNRLTIYLMPLALLGLFFVANATHAASYDFYVDASYDEEEMDGSADKPFDKISKAAEEALSKSKDARKIFVKNGKYEESLTLGDSVELYGQNNKETIISNSTLGTLTLKDNNVLKNITVSGGNSAITVEKKADIKNCIIKNAAKNAINAAIDSNVTITGNKIFNNGKGMYVQLGSKVEISDNEIFDNREEGVDLRNKTKGVISDNIIYSNREGGIELIIGNSDLSIRGNVIKRNKASGIAVQFYSFAPAKGKIEIIKNDIKNNGHYGLLCGNPSGGNHSDTYWSSSLRLEENEIEENKIKVISNTCKMKIGTEVEKSEEADDKTIEEKEKEAKKEIKLNPSPPLDPEEKLEQSLQDIQNKESLIEEENKIRLQIEKTISEVSTIQDEIQSGFIRASQRSKWSKFFIGNDLDILDAVSGQLQAMKSMHNELAALNQTTVMEDNKKLSQDAINDQRLILSEFEQALERSKNSFSLFGWLIKITR